MAKPSIEARQKSGIWTARIGVRNGVVRGFGDDKDTAVDRAKQLADAVRHTTAAGPRPRV